VLATCTGDTGLDGLARVLEGGCLGRGVLWVGAGEVAAVGDVQQAEEEERGVLGAVFLLSFLSHGSGRGRGCLARPRRCSHTWLQGRDERRQ
jgi:hypothetical protein